MPFEIACFENNTIYDDEEIIILQDHYTRVRSVKPIPFGEIVRFENLEQAKEIV